MEEEKVWKEGKDKIQHIEGKIKKRNGGRS